MTYRLEFHSEDGVPDALRACAAEQLADAIQVLREERRADPVEAVHDARKDLKKARSLLRLARTDMPRKRYRAENAALRDVGCRLSDVRDADVMVETVDALAERFVGQLPRGAFTAVRQRFVTTAERSRTTADAAISDGALDELAAIALRVPEWPLEDCDAQTLCAGAKLAYTRGRERFAIAEADPSIENLHEWRKRAKDLWYHARLLEDAWPVVLAAYSEEAHSLSDRLGDDHDLAVLAERLAEGKWPAPVDEAALIEFTAHRRSELQQAAFALGRRLYAERPKAFGRRLGAYLRAV